MIAKYKINYSKTLNAIPTYKEIYRESNSLVAIVTKIAQVPPL